MGICLACALVEIFYHDFDRAFELAVEGIGRALVHASAAIDSAALLQPGWRGSWSLVSVVFVPSSLQHAFLQRLGKSTSPLMVGSSILS